MENTTGLTMDNYNTVVMWTMCVHVHLDSSSLLLTELACQYTIWRVTKTAIVQMVLVNTSALLACAVVDLYIMRHPTITMAGGMEGDILTQCNVYQTLVHRVPMDVTFQILGVMPIQTTACVRMASMKKMVNAYQLLENPAIVMISVTLLYLIHTAAQWDPVNAVMATNMITRYVSESWVHLALALQIVQSKMQIVMEVTAHALLGSTKEWMDAA